MAGAGFEEPSRDYRPDGKPHSKQPRLAMVWRRVPSALLALRGEV
jgi:hypothetical protein